ncbi:MULTISPECIES: YehR family lipoprotein [unclassified Citrobacter]|uniref:YehR family lipoprotein n=1 Tax=unclassified Citrobacter TaxID=2644389 RepID=UPI0017F2924A|nr:MULTISPECIES: YehR family lipoprotein [unclassified Citrobacter]MBA7966815.1 YehR family lipoprotein [Citrobacter sp. RHBSTW-00671]HCJ6373578.1 YehR family lipoprotein [Citrobacter freundii]
MNMFKKLFTLAIASVLAFSLAGCGDKEGSKKYSANLNGVEISITYTYKGDKVLKQTSESKINYASIGATDKESAAKVLDALSAKYKNIAGIEEKLTYSDTYAQENVTIDMEKVDFKALQGISGINISADDAAKGITMKQMETIMTAAGFKEVK